MHLHFIPLILAWLAAISSSVILADSAAAGWGGTDTSSGVVPDPSTAVIVSGQLRGLQFHLGDGAISVPWRENLTLFDVIEGFGGFSHIAAWVTIAEPGKPVIRLRLREMKDKTQQKAMKIPPASKVHFGWLS